MGYGRLVSEQAGSSSRQMLPDPSAQPTTSTPRKSKLKPLLILAAILIVASAISAAVGVILRNKASSDAALHRKPSRAISRTCSKTLYPSLCVDSLLNFPGALTASDKDLVHITVNMTLQRLGKALYDVSDIGNVAMDVGSRSAYEDCLELLADSVDLLAHSLTSVSPASADGDGDGGGSSSSSSTLGSTQDVMTWLSAALTNQDTCTEGFGEVGGGSVVKDQMSQKLKDLSELVSNCLAIYSAAGGDGDDFSGIPIGNRRRRLMGDEEGDSSNDKREEEQFPKWLSRKDRMLLEVPATSIQADIIVSKDGNGTVKTVGEAIKKAPERSSRRIIIYVKAGK